MPIRTDRGHAAAMRRFWSWPLHSPKRAVAIVLGAGILTVGVACTATAITGSDPSTPASDTSISGTSTVETSTDAVTPSTNSPTTADTSTAPATTDPQQHSSAPQPGTTSDGPRGAVTTATEFMRSWVRPSAGVGAQEWLAGVRPYVMPEYQRNLASVEPSNIPATEVTGRAKQTKQGRGLVEVDVPTDADTIRVTVVAQPDGRWLVRSWAPAE